MKAEDKKEQQFILSFGLDEYTKAFLIKALPQITILERPYTVDELMAEAVQPPPISIVCGPPPADIPLIEVAQTLRMNYQSAGIFFTTLNRSGFDSKIFIKNGFSDAFLLPMEAEIFLSGIQDQLVKLSGNLVNSYRKVKLLDVSADTVLDFATYIHLPQNNKTIRVSAEGEVFDPERLKRLKKGNQQTLMVRRDQMPKFYQYTAGQLKKLGQDNGLSETEKREKTEKMIRSLFTGLYSDTTDVSFDQGKAFVQDCNQLVSAYLVGKTDSASWYDKLVKSGGLDASTYSHASNVAAYATLFAIALGIGKPEEIAFAGLLHDIGLANVPTVIQEKDYSQMTPEEKAIFEKHPSQSIDMILSRKMSVSDLVKKIILQHHERYDGKGFPNKLLGTKICKEAQILSIADRFDELCTGNPTRKGMLPKHAIEQIFNDCSQPDQSPYDLELVAKIKNIFSAPSEEANGDVA